jgi:hypothetical protein
MRLSSWTLFRGILQYTLPSVSSIDPEGLPETPITFDIIVGKDGKPCSVLHVREPDPRVSATLEAAIRRWRFKVPVLAGGKRCCSAARVFVYLRKRAGETVLIIPGLNDKGN